DPPTTSVGLLPLPPASTALPQLPPDDQMQQMIQMQLQLMNQQQPSGVAPQHPQHQLPQQPNPPPAYLPPSLHHPSVIHTQQQPALLPSPSSASAPGGGGWMPQLTSSTPAYVPVGSIQPPGVVNPVLASQMTDDDDDLLLAGMGKDPRTMTRQPLYRGGKPSPPSALLTGNESPLYSDDLSNSPPGSGGRTTSLREKRKDNQYESPLSRSGAGLTASRYNQLPMGVKIRKKSSP
uniref:Uncharacterized protein n=1 Tax=Plectus sambesii TaxID=2011161 RepID=A0A914ULY3_9BILA